MADGSTTEVNVPYGDRQRPLRLCDVCGGVDDHPRHVQSIPRNAPDHLPSAAFLAALDKRGNVPASAIAQLMNGRTMVRHMDCCAANGCAICQETERENGGRRGEQLVAHLEARRLGRVS